MPQIIIRYKRYSFNYPVLSEEEFFQIKAILEVDPEFECFPTKNLYEYLLALYDEFKISIGIAIAIGILIGCFDTREFLELLFVPLILWLLLGGMFSIINFTNNIIGYNKYYSKLQLQFLKFETYEQYLYFRKFEALKLMAYS